ncbi:hypothetical protein AV530_013678 [Patagioenas fasciata monilis]|uniref:Uncharacterized protein n=1 Tax=Patagioenas fasciata monilis TaxID=372326 RepID=A0A1V4J7U1_PATFA|nr:hypothetical protein AV530_013678 [Patagioenas fasciata monilis]
MLSPTSTGPCRPLLGRTRKTERISGSCLPTTTFLPARSWRCCITLSTPASIKGLTHSSGFALFTRPGCTSCCWKSQAA